MSDTSQEKTEQPSAQRLREARARGEVWQSQDFTGTVILGLFALLAVAGSAPALAWLVLQLGTGIELATRPETDVLATARTKLVQAGVWSVAAAGLAAALGALISGLQVRGVLSFRRIQPDLERLNPLEGLKRMFSRHTVVEALRLTIKLLALVVVMTMLVRQTLPLMVQAQDLTLPQWLTFGGHQFQTLLMLCCLVFGALALGDLVYQRWRYLREHRMTKDELRREYKDREGDPILRGRRKHLHQEILFSDMLHQVRKASVVIVNPTHIAVALHYEPGQTPLPMVVAKGEGEVARAIREAALQAGVPIYRDVSLARRLHGDTPLNDYIPDELLDAVAQVLIWVERLQRQERNEAEHEN